MRKIFPFLFLIVLTLSCQSKEDKQLNAESTFIFDTSVEKIKKSNYIINIDSFKTVYEKHKMQNAQAGLDFANRFEVFANKLLQKREEIELAENIAKAQRREREFQQEKENRKVWENSKYGKLQKRHPNWSDNDCMKIIDKKIWIGMSYEMLVYQRGKPNSINPSNYGSGIQYQYCWDDYTPSCFYSGENQIITSYN